MTLYFKGDTGLPRQPTAVELAYAAGLIDGEGCIHISHSKPQATNRQKSHSYSLYLKVSMGHRPTVVRLQEIFGVGSIQDVIQPKYNDAYTWLATSWHAKACIEAIYPYLITKKSEADIALEFMKIARAPRGGNGGSKTVPDEILNQRHEFMLALRHAKPSHRFRKDAA